MPIFNKLGPDFKPKKIIDYKIYDDSKKENHIKIKIHNDTEDSDLFSKMTENALN